MVRKAAAFVMITVPVLSCSSSQTAVTPQTIIVQNSTSADSLQVREDATGAVQFLQLPLTNPEGTSDNSKTLTDEQTAFAQVKKLYGQALISWYVDQNSDAAKENFQQAVDGLVSLADVLAKYENADSRFDAITDFEPNGGSPENLNGNGEINGRDPNEYASWLASNIVEHYKNLLELLNEYTDETFGQSVIQRLAYFDLGIYGANSYGNIKAPIAKGHAMDFIPLNIDNERIQKFVDFMTRNDGANVKHLYRGLGKYEKIIKDVLKSEGLSEDLIYLAMIESGFSTSARSKAHAVGPWQFTKKTAEGYGLQVDWWVDERRDIFSSTIGAVQHLKDLFNMYGDWYLALAAYDAGPAGVNRAIRRNNTRDYWQLTKLHREAKNYVPYFIAAASIAKKPTDYGVTLSTLDPFVVDTVTLKECLDMEAIANCALTTIDTIREYNPAILRWCTPPTMPAYLLKLPEGRRSVFVENYEKIPNEKKRTWVRYQVKYGENLSLIANRFGTDVKAIMQANQLKQSNLTTGQYLVIPVAPKSYVASAQEAPRKQTTTAYTGSSSGGYTPKKVNSTAGKKKLTYKVEAGNTLGEIAEWYNILAQNIRDWNGLYYGDPIFPGQILTLWVDQYIPDEGYRNATQKKAKETLVEEPGMKIYVVQDNDTLIGIAKLFSVEVSSIKRWNKLSSNSIRVGDKLKIYVGTN